MTVKMVKSVNRTMEILELFDRKRKPLPAVEIAEELGYPLASTHEILKTLAELDYLSYGTPKWTYVPSRKFPGVVDWVNDLTSDYSRLLDLMAALNDETKETVNLSRRARKHVKIIKGYECRHQIGVSSKPGTSMPVTQSLTGLVSLAVMSDSELELFLRKIKELDPQQYQELDRSMLDEVIAEVRKYGASSRCGLRVDGIGAVCFPVVSESSDETLVIGIVGPSDRIREEANSHRRIIKRLVEQFNVRTIYPIRLQ